MRVCFDLFQPHIPTRLQKVRKEIFGSVVLAEPLAAEERRSLRTVQGAKYFPFLARPALRRDDRREEPGARNLEEAAAVAAFLILARWRRRRQRRANAPATTIAAGGADTADNADYLTDAQRAMKVGDAVVGVTMFGAQSTHVVLPSSCWYLPVLHATQLSFLVPGCTCLL